MTQPYTDADVELVARADFEAQWPGRDWDAIPAEEAEEYRSDAHAVLSALAAADRLRPGPLIGVLIDGRVYHPADVTLMYHADDADSVDEHGNRIDTCGVCPLAPSVSGWALLMQARCPVHGSRPHAEPAVLSWDWREQPDLAQLARVVRDVSGDTVHVREVDTGSDQFAIVIAGTDLGEAAAQAVYERWLHGGQRDESPAGPAIAHPVRERAEEPPGVRADSRTVRPVPDEEDTDR